MSGERFIVPTPGTPSNQRISPDLLISFNANPALYRQDNSYVISRQGKPPDLVMEIASRETGRNDVENKPARYAALGITEYWRFDETGEFHGTRLAGDRLAEGRYEPIAIEELEEGVLQGYSAVLGLLITVGTRPAPVARTRDGRTHTHLRAGAGRKTRSRASPGTGRGPGPRTGGGTGAEGRKRINRTPSHTIQSPSPRPQWQPSTERECGGRPRPKPIPRWDVHFGGLEDDLKDSTALHPTFTSQLGATDSAV